MECLDKCFSTFSQPCNYKDSESVHMFIILSWVRVSQCICTWLLVVSVRRLGLISCPSLQAGVLDHLWGVSSICWGSGVLDSHRVLRVCTHSCRTNYNHCLLKFNFFRWFVFSNLKPMRCCLSSPIVIILVDVDLTSIHPPRNLTSDLAGFVSSTCQAAFVDNSPL